MYHCYTRFYLLGSQSQVFKTIKEMPPLEHFTHEFYESDQIEEIIFYKSDVVIIDLCNEDLKSRLSLFNLKKQDNMQIILLVNKDQNYQWNHLKDIQDVWTMPMSDEEVKFRFLRWQQTLKMSKDYWQTNHYFEATINNIPNLIWYKDKEGIHKKVNDSFCKTVNKTKAQVEGRDHFYIWDVDPNEDGYDCMESDLEVMNTKKTCISEELVKSGEEMKLFTTYKSPLYDLDGSVMGTVGVGIDITQERAYEEELIKKNRTLETIFTTIDSGVLCYTMNGNEILSANRAALSILGYESQEELVQDGFYFVAPSVLDEDKIKLQNDIKELKSEGDSINVEYSVVHKNGQLIHIMGNIKLLKEDNELFYQHLLIDYTDQKLQEKNKEKHQMELVRALSVDYNLVCFFDLNTGLGTPLRVVDDNHHMLDTIFNGEIELNKSMKTYMQKFVYEDDKETFEELTSQKYLLKELAEKKVFYMNYRILNDNEVQYFEMKVVRTNIWDKSHGVVLGFRSVDEETRKEMEQRKLLEDALLQANRASKAKSVFLSNMSHDIRTPMNAIVGFTNLAITHFDDHVLVREYLKKIMTSGNHLLSLINDILDMSRIESGKLRLEEKLCSLPEVLHELHNILQTDIHAKQLELFIDTIDVLDENIYCDKLRLNQVLLNLLSNAIKYTQAGGMINMRVTEKPGLSSDYAQYEFCIQDTGIGMSEEFVAHIFEPFEREKNSTISGIQGTGLGMAITKNIVDMMNGSIEVKSEQGVGTEVIVSLPFRLHSGPEIPKNIPEFKNCRALVVDDDFNTCDSVSYMLQQIGIHAEWTLSGKEAILRTKQAIMRNNHYDIYVIDWLLPDMNGVEVTRRIRKEIGENIPIIVLTAYDWSDIKEEAQEAGVSAFCSKPLFLSELRSCLYSVVNQSDEYIVENEEKEKNKFYTGRILLVEDNELNQEIATAILEDEGFTIEVAYNGKKAVEMIENSEPEYYQLILMDVQMPVMNGYEATRKIRNLKNKNLASIPIFAMTANAFEEDKQEALRSGMNGHIAKPIDIGKLLKTLEKVLK